MLTRSYISKFNTIIKDSELNTGINPISELVYGKNNTRILCYFDHSKLKKMVDDKICPNINKFKHILKITNAGSLDFTQLHCGEISSISDDLKIRATSFDLIFFLIPEEWDNGKGFEYKQTFFNQGYYGKKCNTKIHVDTSKLLSYDGSNWFQSRNGYKWKEEGIYSNETLTKEYELFSSEIGSEIIIGRQHFDIGNENISLDITEIVNKFITGELKNHGIGIAFSPQLERTEDKKENYVGFLTHHTNTFFEPFVETIYCDYISDDRSNFILDKNNRLYLYANIGGTPTNLDEIPTCQVNNVNYEVKQYSKGIYYIDILLDSNEYQENTMYYDVWGNIKYQGKIFDDVELDFVTKPQNTWFTFSENIEEYNHVTPTAYGISEREKIFRRDIRKLNIVSNINYTKNKSQLIDNIEVRLYIKDGTREIDVIPFMKANKTTNENYIIIDTNILIPQRYYVDVKINYGTEIIVSHNILSFDIVDNLNNKYN